GGRVIVRFQHTVEHDPDIRHEVADGDDHGAERTSIEVAENPSFAAGPASSDKEMILDAGLGRRHSAVGGEPCAARLVALSFEARPKTLAERFGDPGTPPALRAGTPKGRRAAERAQIRLGVPAPWLRGR